MRYRIRVRYRGDVCRTHGWCAGVSVPRIDFVWREVSAEQLEQLQSNPMFEIEAVVSLNPPRGSRRRERQEDVE